MIYQLLEVRAGEDITGKTFCSRSAMRLLLLLYVTWYARKFVIYIYKKYGDWKYAKMTKIVMQNVIEIASV